MFAKGSDQCLHQTLAKDRSSDRWQDYVVPQCWEHFTAEDHAVWDLLFARQVELLGSRVVSPFLDGIDLLRLSHPGVPDLAELNAILEPRTGWRTVAVPGLVPDDIFFAMLRERVFPVGNFIRTREQLDYLEEPDCFHDMFGHIPMLAHHDFAAMVEHVGQLGAAAIAAGKGERVGAALLAQRRIRAGAGSGRAQDPRRRPRLELRRSAFQPGERRRSSGCPSRSSERSARPTGTTPSSRAIWCRNRWSGRSPRCSRSTPERLLAIE